MPLLPLHPLGKSAEEIETFVSELLGPWEKVGLYAPEIRIERIGSELVIEAAWMGKDADSIQIDRDAYEAFVSRRIWRLPTTGPTKAVDEA